MTGDEVEDFGPWVAVEPPFIETDFNAAEPRIYFTSDAEEYHLDAQIPDGWEVDLASAVKTGRKSRGRDIFAAAVKPVKSEGSQG